MNDINSGPGIDEVAGSHRHRAGAGQDELNGIIGVHNSTHADDRERNSLDTCQTIRTATGRIAGPDRPPMTLARIGFCRRMSIAIPKRGVD